MDEPVRMNEPVYYLKVEEDITNLSSGRLNVHTDRHNVLLEVSPDLKALGCPDNDYVHTTIWCAMHLKGNPVRQVTGYIGRKKILDDYHSIIKKAGIVTRPDAGWKKIGLISKDPSCILLSYQFPIFTYHVCYGNEQRCELSLSLIFAMMIA